MEKIGQKNIVVRHQLEVPTYGPDLVRIYRVSTLKSRPRGRLQPIRQDQINSLCCLRYKKLFYCARVSSFVICYHTARALSSSVRFSVPLNLIVSNIGPTVINELYVEANNS